MSNPTDNKTLILKRRDINTEMIAEYEAIIDSVNMNILADYSNIDVIDIYGIGIKKFYSMIPKDYVYKNELLYCCFQLKEDLIRSSPEIMSSVFNKRCREIKLYLDPNKNTWCVKAWEYILDSSRQVKLFLKV
jgi:hypothetical protein